LPRVLKIIGKKMGGAYQNSYHFDCTIYIFLSFSWLPSFRLLNKVMYKKLPQPHSVYLEGPKKRQWLL